MGLFQTLSIALLLVEPTAVEPNAPRGDKAPVLDSVVRPRSLSQVRAGVAAEPLTLSDAIARAYANDAALRAVRFDVEISEARTLAALGAYDVTLFVDVVSSVSRSPPRGPVLIISQGEGLFGAYSGATRRLETGGEIGLSFGVERRLLVRPADFSAESNVGLFVERAFIPTLSISHPLLRGMGIAVNRAEIEMGRLAKSAAEAAQQLAARAAVRNTILAYWDVSLANRTLENHRRTLEIVRQQGEYTAWRVEAGTIDRTELLAVEQALARAETRLRKDEHNVFVASLRLRERMGEPIRRREEVGVLPSTAPILRPRRVVLDQEIKRTLASHPSLRQLQLQERRERISVRVAKNQTLPRLDAGLSFSPRARSIHAATTGVDKPVTGAWSSAFGNMFAGGRPRDWVLQGSLSLHWDVQNRRATGAYQEAEIQRKRVAVTQQDVAQELIVELMIVASELETAEASMGSARQSVELAEQTLAAEQGRFNLGESTNFDVLRRVDEIEAADAEQLAAEIEYLRALVQLQALNGEILSAYGLTPS